MVPALITLPGSASVDDVVDVVEREGGVIITNFVDADTVQGLWDDVGPALERQAEGDGRLASEKTRIVPSLVRRTMHSVTILRKRHFLGSARDFLQAPVRAWRGEHR